MTQKRERRWERDSKICTVNKLSEEVKKEGRKGIKTEEVR